MTTTTADALEGPVRWIAGLVQIGAELTAELLNDIPEPLYVTDARGVITHFNDACVGFAGRTPHAGVDRWCVSWRLYTDEGEPLPHDRCPMAVAIQTGRTVRDVEAVAERPDGGRVRFRPYATPITDAEGRVVAGVNLLAAA